MCFRLLLLFMILRQITAEDFSGYINKLRPVRLRRIERGLKTEHVTLPYQGLRPSFFKVMIGDFGKRLKVPVNFVGNFNGMIPYDSILRSPSGCWNVKVREEEDGGLSFWKGWPDFAEAHCLQEGDFVTMKYIGNSQFVVTLYGNNGCEKVLSPTGSNGVKSIPSRKRKECGETSKGKFTGNGSEYDQHKYHAGDIGRYSLSTDKKKCELFKCDSLKRKAAIIEGRTGANQTELFA
ncbi:B3 domain-containing protein Os01g0723500-like isoform X2 [Papaver somniferum]|uniref:B3 domain-containing protein Os01g0723500-like isoform X2 n=1 Tax=Papaver somniferum TaxID=3469 RepID=UPI000E6FDEFA|nr:B3 domain-containing protein Os01g0723500-like isoform X2 [Papaver somniferum]